MEDITYEPRKTRRSVSPAPIFPPAAKVALTVCALVTVLLLVGVRP
jgi:hypothetical protein